MKEYFKKQAGILIAAVIIMVGLAQFAAATETAMPSGTKSDYMFIGNDNVNPDHYVEMVMTPAGNSAIKTSVIGHGGGACDTKDMSKTHYISGNTSDAKIKFSYLKFETNNSKYNFTYLAVYLLDATGKKVAGKVLTGKNTLKSGQYHYQWISKYVVLPADEMVDYEIDLSTIFGANVAFNSIMFDMMNYCCEGTNALTLGDATFTDSKVPVEVKPVEPVYVTITKSGNYTAELVSGAASVTAYVNGVEKGTFTSGLFTIGILDAGDLLRLTANGTEASAVEPLDNQSWNFYYNTLSVVVYVEDPPIVGDTTTTTTPVETPTDNATDNATVIDPDSLTSCEDAVDAVSLLNGQVESCNAAKATIQSSYDSCQSTVDSKNAEITSYVTKISEKNGQIASLNTMVTSLQSQVDKMSSDIESCSTGYQSTEGAGGVYTSQAGTYVWDLMGADLKKAAKVKIYIYSPKHGKWFQIHQIGTYMSVRNMTNLEGVKKGDFLKAKIVLEDGTTYYSTDSIMCQVSRNQEASSWNFEFRTNQTEQVFSQVALRARWVPDGWFWFLGF